MEARSIYIKRFRVILKRNLSLMISFIILTAIFILGFVLSFFSPYDPRRWGTVPSDLPPSWTYLFGTNSLGQDIFWLLTWALRNSLILGFIASLAGLSIGIILGVIAGYKGGLIERIILFFADTFIMMPTLPILILVSSRIKGTLNMFILGLIIASLTWGMPVRNIRSMILSLREREFTYTALFSGSSFIKILFKEYFPHLLPWILASVMGRTLFAIGMEVTLAIFGLSTLNEATLGTMIYWANKYQAMFRGLWWWIGFPVIFILILLISLYLLSSGINEHLNPRSIRGQR